MRRIAILVVLGVTLLGVLSADAEVRSGALAERVRGEIVRALEKATGRAALIRAVSGDVWRGVVLHDVRIAAGRTFAAGVFAQADAVTIGVDARRMLAELLAGRGVLGGITRVTLDRPVVRVGRTAAGRWTVEDLFAPAGPGGPEMSFRATVAVRSGTVVFRDAAGAFATTLDRIAGSVAFARYPIVVFHLAGRDAGGPGPVPFRLDGRYHATAGTVSLGLRASGLDVLRWGPYLVHVPRVRWAGGRADAALRILATPHAGGAIVDVRGAVVARDLEARLDERHRITGVRGVVQVDGAHLTADRVAGAVDRSPLVVSGEVGLLDGGRVDLIVDSPGLDLATLRAVLFPTAAIRMTGTAAGQVRVVGALSSPAVAGRIARARGTLAGEAFSSARSGIRFSGGLLTFPDLAASVAGGRIAGAVRIGFGELPSYAATLAVRGVDLTVVRRFGVAPLALRGRASGFLAAVDLGRGPQVLGLLESDGAEIAGVGVARAGALFWYDRGRIALPSLVVSRGAALLGASGTATADGAFDLAISGVRIDLAEASRLLGLGGLPTVTGTARVTGRLVGTARSPVFRGEVGARDGRIGPLAYDALRGDLTLSSRGASTRRLVVEDREATYVASGEVAWAGPVSVDLSLRDARAERLVSLLDLPVSLTGALEGAVRLRGTLRDLQASGEARLANGRVEGQRIDRAEATFRWGAGTLHLDDAVAATNGSTLRAAGTVTLAGRVDLSFAARDFRLDDVAALQTPFLSASGTATLSGRVSGTVVDPEVRAVVESANLFLNGQAFTRARGDVAYRGRTLSLSPLDLQQNGSRYRVSGTLTLGADPAAQLQVEIQRGRIGTLLGLAGTLPPLDVDGTIDGSIALAGPLSDPRATLAITLRDATMGGVAIREGVVALSLRAGEISIGRFELLAGRGRLAAAGVFRPSAESDIEVSGENLDLIVLRPLLGLPSDVVGTTDFTLQYQGRASDPAVGLQLALRGAGVAGNTFDRLTANAFYSQQTINISRAVLEKGPHRVRAGGTIPFDLASLRFDASRPVALHLELGDADLSLLQLLWPAVERASGTLAGRVDVAGTVPRPEISGFLRIERGTLRLAALRTPIEDLAATVTFQGDRLTVERLTGRLGEGTFSITGGAAIRDFLPESLDLRFAGERLRVEIPPYYAGLADATLRLSGSARSPVLGGDVRLHGGTLTVATAAPGPGVGAPNLAFDVSVRAESLDLVAGPMRTRVDGRVHLGGTARAPLASGRLDATGGSIAALNTTFVLLEGNATFAESRGVMPTIFARAQTVVGSTTVTAVVQGPADHPELLLASDPPMPQDQILAVLGRQAGLGSVAAGDVESLLRQQLTSFLFRRVEEAIMRQLGVNEFRLEYAADQPLQLRIGTFLIRNLYLTLRVIFSEPVRYVWALEYRFTPTRQLALVIDSVGDYSIMYTVRYRF